LPVFFLRLNLTGQVPVVIDGDRVMRESNTIVRYLAAKHKTLDLYPEDGEGRQGIEQWMDWVAYDVNPVIVYPASGTGTWEGALVNTLSPGDRVLMFETGWFSTLSGKMTKALGLEADIIKGDWRSGVNADAIEEKLRADKAHSFKAVAIVHNETSTGVTSNIAAVKRAIDNARHPALLLVDTISSLGSIEYRHDEWGVDVTVGGSQKGLMLPLGLAFNAISDKAIEASKKAKLPRSFLGWDEMLLSNATGFFPYTPSTNLLQGLRVALDLIEEEGIEKVFARHDRAALATRRAVEQWGFEIQCRNETEYSSSLTVNKHQSGTPGDVGPTC